MSQYCQLWMGSLESYMTEAFIMNAFKKMGESPLSVKVIRNKLSGELAGYCFVHFPSDEDAKTVLHKLNGKVIPGTNNLRFKLNCAGTSAKPGSTGEYSLWVGDLSTDIDDYKLFKCFGTRYSSLKTAKVVVDSNGISKGYAFLRFASEDDQMKCCIDMNGYRGLGSRPIRVSSAVPKYAAWRKNETPPSQPPGSTDYPAEDITPTGTSASASTSSYYDSSVWQNYSAWQQSYYESVQDPSIAHYQDYMSHMPVQAPESDLDLIEHDIPLNVDELNAEFLQRDCELYDALESSKWLPVEAV